MGLRIKLTRSYKKDYSRIKNSGISKSNLEEINNVVDVLASGILLSKKYNDHGLTGELIGYRECHIKPDLLLIYKKDMGDLILLLVRIGGHSTLFGK